MIVIVIIIFIATVHTKSFSNRLCNIIQVTLFCFHHTLFFFKLNKFYWLKIIIPRSHIVIFINFIHSPQWLWSMIFPCGINHVAFTLRHFAVRLIAANRAIINRPIHLDRISPFRVFKNLFTPIIYSCTWFRYFRIVLVSIFIKPFFIFY